MSDGQSLLLVLALLYLAECWTWIGHHSVLFSSLSGNRFHPRVASQFLGNRRGSLLPLFPLPPLGRHYLSHLLPVSLDAEGLTNLLPRSLPTPPRPHPPLRALPYDQISHVHPEDHRLLINRAPFADCASPAQARDLAHLLLTLRSQSPDQRALSLQHWTAARFDLTAARAALDQVTPLAHRLRLAGIAFFLLAFAGLPVATLALGLHRVLIPAALLLLLGASLLTLAFIRAQSRLGSVPAFERFRSILTLTLCPPAAIRAADRLTLPALAPFHPVLVAHLLDPSSVPRVLLWFAREWCHPLRPPTDDPLALRILAGAREIELTAFETFRAQVGLPAPQSLLASPPRDGASAAYCPRCQVQMDQPHRECPDCPGVLLVPFPTLPKQLS